MTQAYKLPAKAWLIVGLLWVVGCLNYMDRVMITTMRTSIEGAIPMTEAQFGLLTTSFLAIYGVLSPIAGFLADRFNRSRVVIASLLVWSVVTWLTGHSRTYGELLATRLIMGISEACYIPAALALVTDYHRGTTRSLATGLLLGGAMTGAAMGGLGGWLADRHDWSYAFKLFGCIGIVYACVLAFLLRDPPREGVPVGGPLGEMPVVRFGEALRSLFSTWNYTIALVYWGVLGFAGWMIVGWVPTYLQEHFHLSQGVAGLDGTIFVNVASFLGMIVGGIWADRWSRRHPRACIYVSALGQIIAVPGIFLMIWSGHLWIAIAGLMYFGLTNSFSNSEMMPIICLICDSRYRATGYGIINAFSCLVGGASIFAGGMLRDSHVDVSHLFAWGGIAMFGCGLLLFAVRTPPAAEAVP